MPTLTDITSSFITDAEGHWHDLSKGAFDAFTITHPDQPAKIAKDLFNQPLDQIAQKVKDLAYDKANEYKEALAAFGGAAVTAGIANYAGAEAVGTAVGGPLGAVLGVGIEMGVEWLIDFTDDKLDAYKQGQWVVLDLGKKAKKLADPDHEDFFEFLGDLTMDERVPDLQVGFYVGLAAAVGHLTCYNFRAGAAVDLPNHHVQAVPEAQAKQYDETIDMSVVRELFFAEAEGLQLNSDCPTDPGSEVVYDGEFYSIVSCVGLDAVIEDKDGGQLTVPLSDLKRGRVVNNRSWYYRAEGRAGGVKEEFYTDPESRANFQGDGDGQVIYQGQWCWFPATVETKAAYGQLFQEIKTVLCCVSHLEGSMVCVYQALDGLERWDQQEVMVPCQDELKSMFNNNKQFLSFREAVCQGSDVRNAKLGVDFPGICLGFTNTGQDATRDDSQNWSKIPVSLEAVERIDEKKFVRNVGDRQMAKRLDAAEEIARLNPNITDPAAVTWGVVENMCSDPEHFRRRMVLSSDGADLCKSGANEPKTDNTMMIAGAVAVGLAFYIYSA